MGKALKKITYIIVLLLIFSCKTDQKTTTSSQTEKLHSEAIDTVKTTQKPKFETKNPNCLKESDSLEVKIFRKELTNAIIQKDTLAIMNFVQLSDMDKNISIEKKKESLQIYFEPIMELCFKEVMNEYNLNQLEGEGYFDNKENNSNCFVYKINNSFSSLEVTHIFIFEKIDGEIKLVVIETLG